MYIYLNIRNTRRFIYMYVLILLNYEDKISSLTLKPFGQPGRINY